MKPHVDSEENEEMSRQHERDVFAAQMQYKFDHKLPPFDDPDESDESGEEATP